MTIVTPPPGVSSTVISPPIASTNPLATASPSPTPVSLAVSPRRWNGWNTRSRCASGIPQPRSTTRRSTRPATTRGFDPHRLVVPGVAHRVVDDVRDGALEERGVDVDARQGLGHVDDDVAGTVAQARERGRNDLVEPGRPAREVERSRLQTAHVEQVLDEIVEPIGLGVDGCA